MSCNTRGYLWFMVLALLVLPQPVLGQDCKLLCTPVFVLQPGAVTTDFMDAPSGVTSETNFNFRVVTAIPTALPRTTLVGVLQWTPLNKVLVQQGASTVERRANDPSFVYGPVFNVLNTPLLGFDFDVLGAYGPRGLPDAEGNYTHKLVLEGDLYLKVGNAMATQSRWQNLSVYTMLAYVATGIPDEASPWVLLTGLSLPIAP